MTSPTDHPETGPRIAILVLSTSGLALGRRLRERRPSAMILGPSCVVGRCDLRADDGPWPGVFAAGEPGLLGWTGPLRNALPAIWGRFDAIVAVMALPIVVRLVGPLAADKRTDPAVVVVDDAGRFAIAALGGHGAGANRLTHEVAALLGATPVVTTASDAHGLPAVDLIGRDLGWKIEGVDHLTAVAAAVVRRQLVAVYQDAGPDHWWEPFGAWPDHVHRVESTEALAALRPSAALVISDRLVATDVPTVVYRPPTLIAGIGCKRGTPVEAIADFVDRVFADHGLALGSLATLATVTLKADEPGLIAFAAARGVPLVAFEPAELADVAGVERPSERVHSKIGIPAVAEPAALRAAGADRLLVPKQKGPGVTVAIARVR